MKNFILKIGVLLFITISSNAQEVSDSIRIADNNCATKLARDYMYRMGIFEKENSDQSYSYFSDAGKIARYMATTIDQPISAMTSYCAKISRTLLEYVSASLKEYDAGTSVAA